eukprot:Rmarinus@m.17900
MMLIMMSLAHEIVILVYDAVLTKSMVIMMTELMYDIMNDDAFGDEYGEIGLLVYDPAATLTNSVMIIMTSAMRLFSRIMFAVMIIIMMMIIIVWLMKFLSWCMVRR